MFAAKNELFTTPSGYQIQRSLRFRSSANASLTRTPASSGNRALWTWSGWVKRGVLGTFQTLFGTQLDGSNIGYISFDTDNKLDLNNKLTDTTGVEGNSTRVFRDPAAWYHLVIVFDGNQASQSNRFVIYVNGVQDTFVPRGSKTAGNGYLNSAVSHAVGNLGIQNNAPLDGYQAEVNFIDGQALTPSSFGAINAVTGVWSATRYNGTYGTNGFYLNFTDNSAATATTIGKDNSGNGNNWTPNNISVTAGVTYDSMLDVPLGAGGGERGNYTTLNPLSRTDGTVSEANLKFVGPSSSRQINGTIAVNSGKWYWEVNILNAPVSPRDSTTAYNGFGFSLATIFASTAGGTTSTHWVNLKDNGFYKNFSGTNTDSGSAISSGDVLAIAVDLDLNTFAFYKNNTSIVTGTIGTTAGTLLVPAMYSYNSDFGAMACNFGQRPFSYTPPTGFKALHTGNLAAPVIALPAQNMAATLYTGNSSTQTISNAVNGVSMQPDWVWIKNRSTASQHVLTDSVRGIDRQLFSSLTNAEQTSATAITALNSNGFSLGANPSPTGSTNGSPDAYVAWQWKGGGTAVSNTAGSITSSVSANTTAGFSVVTYTGTGVAATVGHGLGVKPSMIILKNRSGVYDWPTWSQYLPNPTTQHFWLNATNAAQTSSSFNSTQPTSSVFNIGTTSEANGNTNNFVAYCFAAVAGYSAFGSYTGNASTDGPFVFLGFRPKFVLIKCSSTTGNWIIWDSSRGTYNVIDSLRLYPNLSDAEGGGVDIDFVSNGFKFRNTNAAMNGSGSTYIYMAFAEVPFKSALGR